MNTKNQDDEIRFAGLLLILIAACSTCLCSDNLFASEKPTANKPRYQIKLVGNSKNSSTSNIQVIGLSRESLQSLKKLRWTTSKWTRLLRVEVVSKKNSATTPSLPMLGEYQIRKNRIIFTPRFPLEPGVNYRAVFSPKFLPQKTKPQEPIIYRFSIRAKNSTPAAQVTQVFPSGKSLPENLLKFYIHFSAPMSRGEAYKRIELLDARGKRIADPFLELGEELWDPSGTRFTLFIDPGRIKRGLKPREDVGPVFEQGKSYTLRIAQQWVDEHGRPLKNEFRKSFKITAPDSARLDPKKWKLQTPAANTRKSLTLKFPKPLDHALLHRMLVVVDANGRPVAGQIQVDQQETRWRFTPSKAWQAGSYRIQIDTALEDRAGNSIGRPFERSLIQPAQPRKERKTLSLSFQVSSRKR